MVVSDYIEWLDNLESLLKRNKITVSEYDEFHISEAIFTTERILKEQNITSANLTETMVDDYMRYAIKLDPTRKEYYETISCYVKNRLIKK